MRYLQTANDVSEGQFRLALTSIQRDLDRDQSVAVTFKREFANLAKMIETREERYQKKYGILEKKLDRTKDDLKSAIQVCVIL